MFPVNCNNDLFNNYIYDISIIPGYGLYRTMAYETDDDYFYDFDDEYLVISPPSIYSHYDYKSPKTFTATKTVTSDASGIKITLSLMIRKFGLGFLTLVRALSKLIFTIIFKVSGILGVVTVTAAGLARVSPEPVLNCIYEIKDVFIEFDTRYNRQSNCVSQIQDTIVELLVSK